MSTLHFPGWTEFEGSRGPEEIAAVLEVAGWGGEADPAPRDVATWFAARTPREAAEGRERWLSAISSRRAAGAEPEITFIRDFPVRCLLTQYSLSAVLLCDGAPVVLVEQRADADQAEAHLDAAIAGIPAFGVSACWAVALGHSYASARPLHCPEGWVRLPPDAPIGMLSAATVLLAIEMQTHGLSVPPLSDASAAAAACERAETRGSRGLISTPNVQSVSILTAAALAFRGKRVEIVAPPTERGRGLLALRDHMGVSAQAVPITSVSTGPRGGERDVLVLAEVDTGFRGKEGWRWRTAFPDASLLAVTGLGEGVVPAELVHAFGDPHDADGLLPHGVSEPENPIRIEYAHWLLADPRDRTPDYSVVVELLASLRRRGPMLVLVPGNGLAAGVTAALEAAGQRATDATVWGHAHEGWSVLGNDTEDIFVVRASFPWRTSARRLKQVAVVGDLGQITLARLVRALRGGWADNAPARLIIDPESAMPVKSLLSAKDEVDRDNPMRISRGVELDLWSDR